MSFLMSSALEVNNQLMSLELEGSVRQQVGFSQKANVVGGKSLIDQLLIQHDWGSITTVKVCT